MAATLKSQRFVVGAPPLDARGVAPVCPVWNPRWAPAPDRSPPFGMTQPTPPERERKQQVNYTDNVTK
jgi:hypothetical protein